MANDIVDIFEISKNCANANLEVLTFTNEAANYV